MDDIPDPIGNSIVKNGYRMYRYMYSYEWRPPSGNLGKITRAEFAESRDEIDR